MRLDTGQESCVWNDIPRQCQCDVLVGPEMKINSNKALPALHTNDSKIPQTIAIIPEIVFCVHVFEVKDRILATQYDFIPKYDLIQFV